MALVRNAKMATKKKGSWKTTSAMMRLLNHKGLSQEISEGEREEEEKG